jgi:hypothetical protein
MIHFQKGMQSGGSEEIDIVVEKIIQKLIGFYNLPDHGVRDILTSHCQFFVDVIKVRLECFESVIDCLDVKQTDAHELSLQLTAWN